MDGASTFTHVCVDLQICTYMLKCTTHHTAHTGSQVDPNLQPVNLMESRNIIPSSPIVPPPVALPNNLSKFAPNHKVFCSTMNAVPATNGLLNKLKLPFAIHIHPFKDMTHNVSDLFHSLSLSLSLSFFLSLWPCPRDWMMLTYGKHGLYMRENLTCTMYANQYTLQSRECVPVTQL